VCAVPAHGEAILTLAGLELTPDANGEIRLHVDVDLGDVAPNLVSFELDVLHAGLAYQSHAIGSAFEVDGDPLTQDYLDFTVPDPGGSVQNVLSIMNFPLFGLTTGRLFTMTFSLTDPAASLSLLGFPAAESYNGVDRSESLVSEVAPFDLQAVPFSILLTNNAAGDVTMRLATAPAPPPPPPPTGVPEPTVLALAGLGLLLFAIRARRA
jgi:hypothetical protein